VSSGKIKVLDPSISVLGLKTASSNKYRIEEIPKNQDESEASGKKKGGVFAFGHFDTNISNQADPFGDPFFLYVPFGITVRDFKPVIQKKLKIGDELIRAIKIAHVDGLKPKYLPEDAPVVTDKGLQKNVVIGLMHSRPKGASRSKKSSAPRAKERAIVINI